MMEPTLLYRSVSDFHSLDCPDQSRNCRFSDQLDGPESISTSHPDIEWDPSFTTYCNRVTGLAGLRANVPQTLPHGFPSSIKSPRVWSGSDFIDESRFVYLLSDGDREEIDAAIKVFMDRHGGSASVNPDELNPTTFHLPNLGDKLTQLTELIHSGQGFYVIRGLDPSRYSPNERLVAYVGITSYVGQTRACQDAGGSKLIHIKDRGVTFRGAEMRQAPYSNVAQPFHTDVCDILAMQVQELAAEGGDFQIASSGRVYNEIAAKRPDVIHTLAANEWIFDRFSEPPSWDVRPVLLPFGPHGPSFFYSRRPLTGSPVSPRTLGIPAMTERQAEALDMVHFTAMENQLRISAQKGDIILINNLAVMHARTSFVDAPGQQRHVMRMWLRNEQLQWPKPDIVKPLFELKYSKNSPWCQLPVWHAEPPTVPERLLARRFNCS
jgi:hypothetical protein